ncbi:Toll-like receptor [Anopheles darlingi]|uniref:Toll-like receptor n=1 Tax=Anopheles darlingi TaxID=43151 RepID=W5JUT7_ANODA|nr:Toll-like receptor [Anopheles darlingi]
MNRVRYRPLVVVTATILLAVSSAHCFLTNYRGLDVVGLCSANMRNCSCKSYTGSESEIDCPGDDPTIQLRIEPLQSAEVKCRRKRHHDFSQMPQLAIGETKRLTIDYCPLVANRSILEQMDFLGAMQVKLLSLKNNANGAPLERNHFRGLEALDRLTISNVKLDDVLPDLFAHLPNLTWLDLRESVAKLPPSVFHTLPSLRILDLSLNGIQELLPRQLEKLGELRLLSLWRNELANLSRHVFTGLQQLERLDLSANKLEHLPSELFVGLPNLTELALSNNCLRALPKGLFRANRELKKVKLAFQQTTMETLPPDLFQNLPALEHVDLERIGLVKLPKTVFQGSANIRELSLAANRLQSLPPELLHDQHALQMLDLGSNQLTALSIRLLQNTVELRVLRLSQNRISQISAGLLRSLEKLEQLYLNDNQLHTIGLYAFRNTPNLQTLHLQNNQLTSHSFNMIKTKAKTDTETESAVQAVMQTESAVNIETNTETEMEMEEEADDGVEVFVRDGSAFQYLHNLRDLDLSYNFLSTVFRDLLVNAHNLERLNLTNNNITSLTAANLQFLSQDVLVDLERNRIFEINLADIEQLMELQDNQPGTVEKLERTRTRILLNENPLNCNCIVYTLALYLKHQLSNKVYERLHLVADRLTCQGPEQLHGMLVRDLRPSELLCELDTPSTQIRHCPAACNCFVRPADLGVVVKCNGQGLTQIPTLPNPCSFGYRFIELHVENNNVTELPAIGDNDGWSAVQELYASNNSIEELSPAQLPVGLRVLDLTRNKLTHIAEPLTDWMAQSPTLTAIRLAQNAWVCSCETASLLAFALANHNHIEDFGRIKCADGRAFGATLHSELCSTEPYTAIILMVCMILLIVASMVALLSLLYYNYHLELKVWLFRHGLFRVVEDELDQDKQYDAFLSYSHKDESFVTEHLLPVLERHPLNFKICWHMRDWVPGEMITSQILSSVEKSRRTIIVLSSNFLVSLWGQLEFRTAHLQSMNERRNRVIIIIYDDIGSIDDLEPELRAYLKTNTYVRWGDPWFWDKVRYAMPHPPRAHSKGASGGGLFVRKLQSSVDDKLELIKPTAPQPTAMTADTMASPLSPQPSIPSDPNNSSGKATVSSLPPHQVVINSLHYQHQQQRPQLLIPANGHINGAFLINSNAKQSDV